VCDIKLIEDRYWVGIVGEPASLRRRFSLIYIQITRPWRSNTALIYII